jgi:hypothetical protein
MVGPFLRLQQVSRAVMVRELWQGRFAYSASLAEDMFLTDDILDGRRKVRGRLLLSYGTSVVSLALGLNDNCRGTARGIKNMI